MQFDFTKAFDQIGSYFRTGLSKRMKSQRGIDDNTYSSPEMSTLKARRSMKGKAASASTKRLVVTGELSGEAFDYKASATGVKIFARNVSHLSGVSYDRLIEYNSRGQSKVNRNIKNPPLVFPTNKGEIELMMGEMEVARRLFATEAKRQMREKAVIRLKVALRVG